MKLYDLLEQLPTRLPNVEITGVTDRSQNVRAGMLFVCIKGQHFDGHSVAAEMLEKGAVAVVVERTLDLGHLGERQILVSDTRAAYGNLCAAWYGHPERALRMIGVTGTNGKTTTATLIQHLLQKTGHRVGLIGTIQYEIGERIVPAPNTTPLTDTFLSLLAEMVAAGCDTVVMEVSSFGLEQQRIGPAWFDIAVFTNLTQDHLDIHGSMENYYQAKKLLFSRCGLAICNVDDAYGRRLCGELCCAYRTYGVTANGTAAADYLASDCQLRADGTAFALSTACARLAVSMRMTGLFNVSNATAALAVCLELGESAETLLPLLAEDAGVRGRCEVIPTGRAFTVICDYAHTPDALEKILSSVKTYTAGKLIALFGCGGDRDATKRPKMAAAAAKYADALMITSDNPRSEDPLAIIDAIVAGLKDASVRSIPYTIEPDRAEAIYCAMRTADAGDVIVLAGKGHEDYQLLANQVRLHMDERELVAAALQRMAAEDAASV